MSLKPCGGRVAMPAVGHRVRVLDVSGIGHTGRLLLAAEDPAAGRWVIQEGSGRAAVAYVVAATTPPQRVVTTSATVSVDWESTSVPAAGAAALALWAPGDVA